MASPRERPPQSHEPELTPEERGLLPGGGTGFPDLDQKLIELVRTATESQRASIAIAFSDGVFGDAVDFSNRDANTAEKMRRAHTIGIESTSRYTYHRPIQESPPQQPASHEPESATPEERFARLKTENPDIHPNVLDDLFRWGIQGNQTSLDGFLNEYFTGSPGIFIPEQKTKIIDAYNLGAKTAGHPLYASLAAGETAEETAAPITEPAITETPYQTPELSRSTAEKEKLVVTLDEVKDIIVSQFEGHATIKRLELTRDASGGLMLAAALDAGLLGGEIVIIGTIVNTGDEIAIANADVQARGYVKTRIENNLSHFYQTIKTHFENRYGKPISRIQIADHDLEITFAESPAPSVTTQLDAEGAAQLEPASILRPKSDEMENAIDPELAELQQRLAAARAEYAKADLRTGDRRARKLGKGLELDEQYKKGGGGLALYRNMTPEEITAELQDAALAQNAYRDALNAVRDYHQQRLASDPDTDERWYEDRRFFGWQKELLSDREAMLIASVADEAVKLYDLKTQIRANEWTKTRGERFDKATSMNRLYKMHLATGRTYKEVGKEIGHAVMRVAEWYRNLPMKNKLIVSALIFGGGITGGAMGIPFLIAAAGGATMTQRILGGSSAAIGAEALGQKYFEKKSSREVVRKAETLRLARLLNGALGIENERLNRLMFEQEGRKTREKYMRLAVAGTVFAGIAAGAPGRIVRFLVGEAEATEVGRNVLSYVNDAKSRAWNTAKGMMGFGELEKPMPAAQKSTPLQSEQTTNAGKSASVPPEKSGSSTNPDAPPTTPPPPAETPPTAKTAIQKIEKTMDELRAHYEKALTRSENTSSPTEKATLAEEKKGIRERIYELRKQKEILEKAVVPIIGAPPTEATPPPPATPEPTIKVGAPAPSVETPPPDPATPEPAPATVVKPTEIATPRTAAEVAARARAHELATVQKGEGAWQAVRRQMYARLYDDTQKNPTKYGMTAEQAVKLPKDMEHPPKTGKIAKLLDRETLTTLKNAGYINQDGTTKLGMRPDARVILSPDNKISLEYEGKGKPTYAFPEQKAGATQTADETRRGRAAGGRTYQDYTAGIRVPDETTQFIADSAPEEAMTSGEYAASPAGLAAAEAAAVKTESGNLRAAHLTRGEYRPIAQMRGETFIKELDRHAAEINEYRAHGGRKPDIFINKGALTARGFRVELSQAEKYLDLSERLEKHLKTLRFSERSRLLKQPLGELLRALSLTK